MDAADVAAIQRRGLRDFLRWVGSSSPGARLFEAPGVAAAVVPATPARSVVNSVAYEDHRSLASAYEDLAAAYEGAGVHAWTVWTPDWDARAVELLTARGHALDGTPGALVHEDLPGFEGPPPGDLDWDDHCDLTELAALNDDAYGLADPDGMAPALAGAPAGLPIRAYRARVDGRSACVLAVIDHDDDLGVYMVATPERYRRRGLASRLLAVALRDACERGLRTSSLQASAAGEGVYVRLGYHPHFRLRMYERRR